MPWKRYRFYTCEEDYRPVIFPPSGPWWCTGYTGDDWERAIIAAYLPEGEDIRKYWPEAEDIEFEGRDSIQFTDRFPKPKWWTGNE